MKPQVLILQKKGGEIPEELRCFGSFRIRCFPGIPPPGYHHGLMITVQEGCTRKGSFCQPGEEAPGFSRIEV